MSKSSPTSQAPYPLFHDDTPRASGVSWLGTICSVLRAVFRPISHTTEWSMGGCAVCPFHAFPHEAPLVGIDPFLVHSSYA